MAASTETLLGPPEIYQTGAPIAAATSPLTPSGDPLVDLMVANYNNKANQKKPPMGTTVNNSPTYMSSGNPCLDFFFHIVPETPAETLNHSLEKAWEQDPLKALKLVCNLRGVRGTGKSDKEGFYNAALWLHTNHPKTLASNVSAFAGFGYLKDLLEILFRLLERPKTGGAKRGCVDSDSDSDSDSSDDSSTSEEDDRYSDYSSDYCRSRKKKRVRVGAKKKGGGKKEKGGKKKCADKHEEERIRKAKRVVKKFNNDPNFKFLHQCVSDLFAHLLRSDMELLNSGDSAHLLRSDMELLNSGDSAKISLAAKWCPSLDSYFDRVTLLCETIAKKVFPMEEYPEYQGVEEAHYAYRVRDRLRKEVLVPLRKALNLPEVCIISNEWGSIPYETVPSDAIKIYKDKFLKHDRKRFEEYQSRVKSGEAKIASASLLPHTIIRGLKDPISELQWTSMVADMAKKGKLSNSLAVCDMSRSMKGVAMEAAAALGVLVSELSEGAWKGKLITFSNKPKLEIVGGDNLRPKTHFVKRVDSGSGKDLLKVFDVLLQVAVEGKIKVEEMVKKVFVFSDMEFSRDTSNRYNNRYNNKTDYMAIEKKFKENGYGDCVPEIVFWNLHHAGDRYGIDRFSQATPVPANQPGVALVSGFSKNPLTLFLEGSASATTTMDPESVMNAAISGEEYNKLVVID